MHVPKTFTRKQVFTIVMSIILLSLLVGGYYIYNALSAYTSTPITLLQPSVLNVKISPKDVKLHVNETQVFTAIVYDGTPPYSYVWKRDMNTTIGYEQNVTFSFSDATYYTILSVDVVDSQNRVGYDVSL